MKKLLIATLLVASTAQAHPIDEAYKKNPEYYPHYQFVGRPEYTNLVVDYIHWKRVLTDNLIVLAHEIGKYEGRAQELGRRVPTAIRAYKDLWFTYLKGVAMNICTDFAGNEAICKEHRDGLLGVNMLVESAIADVQARNKKLKK